jgi:hypothetical protein
LPYKITIIAIIKGIGEVEDSLTPIPFLHSGYNGVIIAFTLDDEKQIGFEGNVRNRP